MRLREQAQANEAAATAFFGVITIPMLDPVFIVTEHLRLVGPLQSVILLLGMFTFTAWVRWDLRKRAWAPYPMLCVVVLSQSLAMQYTFLSGIPLLLLVGLASFAGLMLTRLVDLRTKEA